MKGEEGIKLFLKRLQIFTTETLEVQQAFLQILKVQICSEISFSKHAIIHGTVYTAFPSLLYFALLAELRVKPHRVGGWVYAYKAMMYLVAVIQSSWCSLFSENRTS